eukprot:6179786-Pleurochrysis_carterae.AAC.4
MRSRDARRVMGSAYTRAPRCTRRQNHRPSRTVPTTGRPLPLRRPPRTPLETRFPAAPYCGARRTGS